MTCFISDLTSDNHLDSLQFSFHFSSSLSRIQQCALDESGQTLKDSSKYVLMLTDLWVPNKTKMFAFAS